MHAGAHVQPLCTCVQWWSMLPDEQAANATHLGSTAAEYYAHRLPSPDAALNTISCPCLPWLPHVCVEAEAATSGCSLPSEKQRPDHYLRKGEGDLIKAKGTAIMATQGPSVS